MSYRSTLQSRTTTYSCSKNSEKLDESLLSSRPLPWVVRVYFESENSINGIICSGTNQPYDPNFEIINQGFFCNFCISKLINFTYSDDN